ncbi:cell wall-binding repeat-containing protein [Peptostreptococcus equinus]|uniref:Cell wall-binding repeat-containing protein n=1 Tax=Peptostreptococcus equinus TaxID=3003601 RepID=A0ABY7JT82_9FIRM|nr:cell wall-binding repeat-containing protein [Peptostreptococcus sp. CBA3647]WAW15180.1 cell wall-binding repeat-containing protein [Peptostreptococcus sp. CBA3647]
MKINKIRFKRIAIKMISLSMAISLCLGTFSSSATNTFIRVNGNDRYETSKLTSEYMNSDVLVLASGSSFADALSAVNICNKYNAKLLLVRGDENLRDYIKKANFKKIYIVGGNSTISAQIEENIKGINIEIKRLAGIDRYATNLETLKDTKYKNLGLADGTNYADALSSSKFLKEKELGLMLINPKINISLPEGMNVSYIFGGVNSVPEIGKGQRIAGKNRYDTSIEIARMTESINITYVSGRDYADALSAVNIANSRNSDVVLVPITKNISTTNLSAEADEIYVVGGQDSVWEAAVNQAIKGTEFVQIDGKYSYITENEKNYLIETSTNKKFNYNDTKNGIINLDSKMYLLNTDSSIRSGWIKNDSQTFYSELKTGFIRGWKKIGNSIYYFSPSDYHMYSGDIIQSTGEGAYWFGINGELKTGTKAQGYRRKSVKWYGPNNIELQNGWLRQEDAKSRFRGQDIVNFALQYDGLPFKWYGSDLRDSRGVYCCGAVYSAYKEFGIRMMGPNDMNIKLEGGYIMVRLQYQKANEYGFKYIPTNFNNMRPGDINYSAAPNGGGYNHAALYIGKNGDRPMTIHATLADGYVTEPMSIITNTWGYHYLNTLRYIN